MEGHKKAFLVRCLDDSLFTGVCSASSKDCFLKIKYTFYVTVGGIFISSCVGKTLSFYMWTGHYILITLRRWCKIHGRPVSFWDSSLTLTRMSEIS